MPTAGTARTGSPGAGAPERNSTLAAEKATLRAAMKAARAVAASGGASNAAGDRVKAEALALAARRAATVISGYWSIGDELDARPALRALRDAGRTVALPVLGARGAPLTFRQWSADARLEPRLWGIQEPAPDAPEVVPDLLLVPLLAFDRRGNRLGYGGGYYDRTLNGLRATRGLTVYACGVCFAAQEVASVPCAPYDQQLDAVITEEGLLTFHLETGESAPAHTAGED